MYKLPKSIVSQLKKQQMLQLSNTPLLNPPLAASIDFFDRALLIELGFYKEFSVFPKKFSIQNKLANKSTTHFSRTRAKCINIMCGQILNLLTL